MKKKQNALKFTLAALYVLLMVYLLFLQRLNFIPSSPIGYSLIPFKTTFDLLNKIFTYNNSAAVISFFNFFGNIIMFVPLGFFLSWIFTVLRKWWKVVLVSAFVMIVLEALQYFTHLGAADIDDVLFNSLGAYIGYLLFKLLNKLTKNKIR